MILPQQTTNTRQTDRQTVNILLAGSDQDSRNSVVQEAIQTLKAKLFLTSDADEMLRLYQQHDFALFIFDETTLVPGEQYPIPPLSPATTILSILPPGQEPLPGGKGPQGEYRDSIAQPLSPSRLLTRIHTLLNIHHMQQELLSCQNTLQDQRDKNHQCQLALEQQHHYLNLLSVRDGLTGLFNRRHLSQALEQEIDKARTQNSDLTMLLIDIDYFNETNRVSGQLFGDSILNEFSARLTQNARENDLCFRFSGSDFIVLLPQTDLTNGREYAERLRLVCSDKPFTSGYHSRSVTVSIGVVSLLEHHPESLDEFINMADRARYQAKTEGRNRVIVYDQNNIVTEKNIDTVALLQETLQRILKKTKESSLASIHILTQNVTGKSQDEHIHLAARYIQLFCERLGLPGIILETFSNALMIYSCFRLLLHRELLSKKEHFNYEDRKMINDLPYKLAELTRHFDYFSKERHLLLCHGERYDGKGYPEGLAGEEIPLAARIFSLADGLAAMSSDRPHRKRLSPPQILKELAQGAGTQWDPSLVLLTLDILSEHHFFPIDNELLLQTRTQVSEKIV